MKKFLFILLLIAASGTYSSAQCPMCRTAVESGMDDGHTKGKGLNDGILYLLAAPYLTVAIVGGLWYRKNKAK
ncbi:MAG: hypothetical protein JXR19_01145 [Bacteroidia bacterium]